MDENLKRSIMLIDAELVAVGELIRGGHDLKLTEDEIADLLIIEEVQSTVLARLANIAKRLTGSDDFLSELDSEQLEIDPYPSQDDDDDDDDLLKQFIDVNT